MIHDSTTTVTQNRVACGRMRQVPVRTEHSALRGWRLNTAQVEDLPMRTHMAGTPAPICADFLPVRRVRVRTHIPGLLFVLKMQLSRLAAIVVVLVVVTELVVAGALVAVVATVVVVVVVAVVVVSK